MVEVKGFLAITIKATLSGMLLGRRELNKA
jgi:hypothetical protein